MGCERHAWLDAARARYESRLLPYRFAERYGCSVRTGRRWVTRTECIRCRRSDRLAWLLDQPGPVSAYEVAAALKLSPRHARRWLCHWELEGRARVVQFGPGGHQWTAR